MSHGLPDYYRGVDIAYQALSEMINRPKYGAAQLGYASKNVAAVAETTLLTVTGKGMIYGGALFLEYTALEAGSVPRLYVDDVLIGDISFYALNVFNLNAEHIQPLYLVSYDDINFIYAVGFSHGITFETSFKVAYFSSYAMQTPNVYVRVIYALV